MPHNERCRKPDSIGDKRRKKNPACSVVEQAGVPIDRVFGLSIDRQGLFYLLTLESVGFVAIFDIDMTIVEKFVCSADFLGFRNLLN